jgi:hypothetical protein
MVKILILALFVGLAGCMTTKGGFCAVSSPIRLSAPAVGALSDTEVKTLLARNRKGQVLCGWQP